jgi:hypothetical protein
VLVSESCRGDVDGAVGKFKNGLKMAIGLHTRLVEDLTGDANA